ncbi:HTH myb-type domain-containing protein [Abeliophyllum distichum]|uniref:HTH myb-type domain-containing protein n=1 Tax=Abeliophyllum distichum TaxID=126358 RepID=A0ABD1Q5L9_9LAMI
MVDKSKRKIGSITEQDVCNLLQMYSATTVLVLLQEVAQVSVSQVKINWNELVKRTSTGISNAREYQMLWRHLAYRDALIDTFDNDAQPLDDESDLEYELEASPVVSNDASLEAAAYVKVLIASMSPSDSSLPNGSSIEAPLTINIPNGMTSRVPSDNSNLASCMQGTNITIPVHVQQQQLPSGTCTEGLESNGPTTINFPPRKKRKAWSAAEDMELIAAVQKFGEGNWANILKGDFKGDRSASQLSQRWHIIRKRQGNLNLKSSSQLSEAQLAARRAVSLALNMPMGDNLKATSSINSNNCHGNLNVKSSSQLSEVQLAARRAVSLALNMPMGDKLKATSSIDTVGASSNCKPGNSTHPAAPETSPIGKQFQYQPQQDSTGPLNSHLLLGPALLPPSDAASLIKAAQSKNAVHILPGGISVIKSSVAGSKKHLSRNVVICAATPLPTYSVSASNASKSTAGTQQAQDYTEKLVASAVRSDPTGTCSGLNVSSELVKDTAVCSSVNGTKELIGDQDVDEAALLGCAPMDEIHDTENKVENHPNITLGSASKEHNQVDQTSNLASSPIKQNKEGQFALASQEVKDDADSSCLCSSEATGNDNVSAECKSTEDNIT